MIAISALLAGVVLLLVLLAVAAKGWLASDESSETETGRAAEQCPEEIVDRIFSSGDWEFVRGLKAGSIETIFQRERKRIALTWVQQMSAMVRAAARAHMQAARASANLEFLTEAKMLAQFASLMAGCEVLAAAVRIGGPLWLSGLAQFAQRLSQRAIKLQEAVRASTLVHSATPRIV